MTNFSSIFAEKMVDDSKRWYADQIFFKPSVIFEPTDEYEIYFIKSGYFVKEQCIVIQKKDKLFSFGFNHKLRGKEKFIALESPYLSLGLTFESAQDHERTGFNPLNEKADKINDLILRFTDLCDGQCEGVHKRGVYYQIHYMYESKLSINNCGNLLNQIFPEINMHLGCAHRLITSTADPTLRIAGKRSKKIKKSKQRLTWSRRFKTVA